MSKRFAALQLPDRVAVGGREDLVHRLAPRQPLLGGVLGGIEGDDADLRHEEAEDVLAIVRDAGPVARPPLRPDLITVLLLQSVSVPADRPVSSKSSRRAVASRSASSSSREPVTDC